MEWGPNTKTFEAKDNGQRKLGWGPNTKAFEAKDNGQRKLGWPQHGGFRSERQRTTQVGVAPTQRNAVNISTSKAS
ncbi:hypothetical protein [Staphylococcus lugdunensis]|uniref:hypothetical protein n=1 Tax=Staphylococcus lugdunensis TaxID=28035 RepID=UPI0011AB50D2|nr:hypothetical protein [Staphylococcus lugdunensis]MCH8673018.1 hypothetical protein [Staphylococcus lugdunensis]MCH8674357.1 hypothetical protein [Staphylococcus lugdunensis]MCI2762101.1 hypothetical protein [Staphylococcus lugdunensis]MCI2805331.1 hypothetical protein [Staphylococcus lugdunensis]MCI2812265.1 hypothetical protein [Staphylococcus lugdunensis]